MWSDYLIKQEGSKKIISNSESQTECKCVLLRESIWNSKLSIELKYLYCCTNVLAIGCVLLSTSLFWAVK